MKSIGSYRMLSDIQRDIHYQASISPAFSCFNREKIKRFFQENKNRLQIVSDKVSAAMELHIKKDDNGKFLQLIKPEGTDNSWDYKTPEDEDLFKKELDDIMSTTIEIYL